GKLAVVFQDAIAQLPQRLVMLELRGCHLLKQRGDLALFVLGPAALAGANHALERGHAGEDRQVRRLDSECNRHAQWLAGSDGSDCCRGKNHQIGRKQKGRLDVFERSRQTHLYGRRASDTYLSGATSRVSSAAGTPLVLPIFINRAAAL